MNFAAQKAIYDTDLAAVEPEMPVTFYYLGKPYQAQLAQTLESQLMQDAGFLQQYDLSIVARYSMFAAGVNPPVSESEIQIADTKGVKVRYTVKNVINSPDGVAATYALKANN